MIRIRKSSFLTLVISCNSEQKTPSSTGVDQQTFVFAEPSKNSNGETYSKFWNSSAFMEKSKPNEEVQSNGDQRYSLPNQPHSTYSHEFSGMFYGTVKNHDSSSTKGYELLQQQGTTSEKNVPLANRYPVLPTLSIRQPSQVDTYDRLVAPQTYYPIYETGQLHREHPGIRVHQAGMLDRGDSLESKKIEDSYIMMRPQESPKNNFNNFSTHSSQVQRLFDSIKPSSPEPSPTHFFRSMAASPQNNTDPLKSMQNYLPAENGVYLAPHH
jgi:hypothetical protein